MPNRKKERNRRKIKLVKVEAYQTPQKETKVKFQFWFDGVGLKTFLFMPIQIISAAYPRMGTYYLQDDNTNQIYMLKLNQDKLPSDNNSKDCLGQTAPYQEVLDTLWRYNISTISLIGDFSASGIQTFYKYYRAHRYLFGCSFQDQDGPYYYGELYRNNTELVNEDFLNRMKNVMAAAEGSTYEQYKNDKENSEIRIYICLFVSLALFIFLIYGLSFSIAKLCSKVLIPRIKNKIENYSSNKKNYIQLESKQKNLLEIKIDRTEKSPLLNNHIVSHQLVSFIEVEKKKVIFETNYNLVYEGKWINNVVAVKEPRNIRANSAILNEIAILRKCNHSNIIKMLAISNEPCFVILEYMNAGSLYDVIQAKNRNLDSEQILNIALNIAKGLQYLHEQLIVHRDIKSLNVLLQLTENQYQAKISDFGSAKTLSSKNATCRSEFAGTPRWAPPEAFNNEATQAGDIYSYGVVLWELVARKLPLKNFKTKDIPKILISNKERPEIVPKACSYKIATLITQFCWRKSPPQRPTAEKIIRYLENDKLDTSLLEASTNQNDQKLGSNITISSSHVSPASYV